jgi:SAM-dependent methyltransferase
MTTGKRWDREWRNRQVADDIGMRDFFSGRQYICRYFPWWGRALEAGCGLGRYVFYFAAQGLEIVGVDFSSDSISKARAFAVQNAVDPGRFMAGDITNLPFECESFSYYISLGVLEHFVEGPQKALAEAYRVLAPGGILMATTPNKFSLDVLRGALKHSLRRHWHGSGSALAMSTYDDGGEFFQYWYSLRQISRLISSAGFDILEDSTIDLRFPIFQKQASSAVWRYVWTHQDIIDLTERTPLRMFGGNSVVVAVKPAEKMRCFICGGLRMRSELKSAATIPVCPQCRDKESDIVNSYLRRPTARYGRTAESEVNAPCAYCAGTVKPDGIFGDFGFDRRVCAACLRDPHIRGELFSRCVVLTWKPYGQEG